MKYLAVKNFEKFQHYRDRSPPWIKLYNAILDDYEFCALPDASRYHLLAIMLLASRSDNRIPADATWIAGRIGARGKVDLDGLIASGFLRVISGATDDVAECKQDASKPLEREEREREGETEKSRNTAAADAPADSFALFWKQYPRKVGKPDAAKSWRKATKVAPAETILAGLARFRFPDDAQFIPHPATWLNKGRWADEPAPAGRVELAPGVSPPNAEIDQWRLRLKTYKPGGFWPPSWGPRPGEDGCEVPSGVLAEIQPGALQ